MLIPSQEVRLKCGTIVTLKSPQIADAEKLLKHLRLVFREAYRNMNQPPDYFDNLSVEEEEKILADFSASTSKFMISAFHGPEIVGNLGCFGSVGIFLKHTARIGMDVDKSFRGKGLVSAFMKKLDLKRWERLSKLPLLTTSIMMSTSIS